MRSLLKFLAALAVAFLAMLAFRALAFTIYTVETTGMAPTFQHGDRVMVNRWSYGLRTGGEGLFAYGRLFRRDVGRSDVLAVEDSLGRVLFCRCLALPGDTVTVQGRAMTVPGLVTCALSDYYCVQPLAKPSAPPVFVVERQIIGRACLVVYSHDPDAPFWKGYRPLRFLLPR